MILPTSVKEILHTLHANGYKAYVVGGCVRDSLMSVIPNDYDITTSASPDAMMALFQNQGYTVIPTGLKHGTITLNKDHKDYEITTFRTEGHYLDSRHPSEVSFVKNIEEDLSRRDFTMNAMAYNEEEGYVDLFHGKEDLNLHILRTVGDPTTRFTEDGLRILRALRFSSRLGFAIEEETAKAIHACKNLLHEISAERMTSELFGIIKGPYAETILRDFKDVFFTLFPEMEVEDGFDQKNPAHPYTLYEHTIKSLSYSKIDDEIRLALFFHDIGKCQTFLADENGIYHYKGHPEKSLEIATPILKRMRLDKKTETNIQNLILFHDSYRDMNAASVKKFVGEYGLPFYEKLVNLHLADTKAHSVSFQQKYEETILWQWKIAKEAVENHECLGIKDLKIDGNDLLSQNIHGKAIKEVLEYLLEKVLCGHIQNEKDVLLNEAIKHVSVK